MESERGMSELAPSTCASSGSRAAALLEPISDTSFEADAPPKAGTRPRVLISAGLRGIGAASTGRASLGRTLVNEGLPHLRCAYSRKSRGENQCSIDHDDPRVETIVGRLACAVALIMR